MRTTPKREGAICAIARLAQVKVSVENHDPGTIRDSSSLIHIAKLMGSAQSTTLISQPKSFRLDTPVF